MITINTQKWVRKEPLLLHVERSQLRWSGQGCFPDASLERSCGHLHLREDPAADPGHTGETLSSRLSLERPQDPPGGASRGAISSETATPATQSSGKQNGAGDYSECMVSRVGTSTGD